MRVATRVGSIESLARLIARIKALHGVYTVTRR